MNSAHPRIRCEIEKPNTSINGQSFFLLDLIVTIQSGEHTEFEFHEKKAKKPIFLNYRLSISNKTKRSIIVYHLRGDF